MTYSTQQLLHYIVALGLSFALIYTFNLLQQPARNTTPIPVVSSHINSPAREVPQYIDGASTVTASELFSFMLDETKNLLIIDVRSSGSYSHAHIPGAVSLPNEIFTTETLAQLSNKNPEASLVIYCAGVHCGKSVDATNLALETGLEEIYWFRGGIEEWLKQGYPTRP